MNNCLQISHIESEKGKKGRAMETASEEKDGRIQEGEVPSSLSTRTLPFAAIPQK
jgi:hypothetical protein